MKKALWLLLATFLGAGSLLAQSKKINYAKSSVSFIIKNAGLKVDGRFESYAIDLAFDPKNLSSTKVDAVIKTASINTGIDGRDKHLRKEEFFNASVFPSIHFKVTGVKTVSSSTYILQGKLTIKDVSKDISLPMKISKLGNEELFESTIVLNRLDYHVGEDSWVMSDDVTVSLKIVAE